MPTGSTIGGITRRVLTGAMTVALSCWTDTTASRTHSTCGTTGAGASTAGLTASTTGRAAVAGAVPTATRTTDRLGAPRTGWTTGIAQTFAMRGIAGTLTRSRRVGAEDGGAEVSTRAVAGKSETRKEASQGSGAQNATETSERLAA